MDNTPDSLNELRARYTRIVARAMIFVTIAGLPVVLLLLVPRGLVESLTIVLSMQGLFALLGVVVLMLLQRGRSQLAVNLLLSLLIVAACGLPLAGLIQIERGTADVSSLPNAISGPYLILATAALISSAALARRAIYRLSNLLVLGVGLLAIVVYQTNQPDPSIIGAQPSLQIAQVILLGIISAATRFFIAAAQGAVEQTQRASSLLETSTVVGRIISQELELNTLLPRAVELIRERFRLYHVQVFLLDEESEYANLIASTGQAGRELLSRQHRLAVGSQTVIGRVTKLGNLLVARRGDGVHAHNELLPDTRSELALPLIDGSHIIGALDLQSIQADAFTPMEIQALQIIAGQLTSAIRNARLFQAQTSSGQENKRLFLEAEASLREIQRLNRQLTKTAWSDYMEASPISGVTLDGSIFAPAADWTDAMREASQRLRPATRMREDGQRVIAVPILLRGEVLGAIEVEVDASTQEREVAEFVQSIAQRLAVSLESARLFEEAQQASAQEQHINEIVNLYQSATSVEDLLQVTLLELREALGAEGGMIRLGSLGPGGQHNGGAAAS